MPNEIFHETPTFAVANVDVFAVTRKKGHIHSCRNGRLKHGFIYIVQGVIGNTFFHNSVKELSVHSGELMFIPKNCQYTAVYLDENTKIKMIQFDLSTGTLPDYLSQPQKIEIPQVGERIDAFFSTGSDHTSGNSLYYLSCLYGLLWQIHNSYAELPVKYKRLQKALSYIADHAEINCPISYYSQLCRMSEGTFRRLFRECTGQSPVTYRNHIRLSHAKAWLQSGEYTVSEASEASGFTNLSFFIRLYKKTYGHTPKQE